jgi:hypothetical protein
MKFFFCFCSALLLFVTGCKNNPMSPGTTVSGIVKLFDGNGNPLSSDGVLVSLRGSSVTATAQTDSTGFWRMNGLPMLPATFIYTKQGFGSMKTFNFQVNGKDSVAEIDMDRPSTEAINLNFQSLKMGKSNTSSEPTYYIQGDLQDPPYWGDSLTIVLCISADSSALIKDPSNATVTMPFLEFASFYDGSFSDHSTSSLSLITYPFNSGTKIYALLCIAGIGKKDFSYRGLNCSNYYDPILGRQVYTALSSNGQVLSGMIP